MVIEVIYFVVIEYTSKYWCLLVALQGQKSIETPPVNLKMSLFEKCFKSCFGTEFRIYVKKIALLVSKIFSKVLYAPSYGRNKFCIEVWSQCRIFRGRVFLLGEPEAKT